MSPRDADAAPIKTAPAPSTRTAARRAPTAATQPARVQRNRKSRHLISPALVLHLAEAVRDGLGGTALAEMLDAAEMDHLPTGAELVPEAKVLMFHNALRDLYPDRAAELLIAGGEQSALDLMAEEISDRATAMLKSAPWPIAAWLISKTIKKSAWTFSGTGAFRVRHTLDFEIQDNPLVRGHTAQAPACHWHRGYFGKLYRIMVHPQLECFETACCATGAPSCRFEIRLRSGASFE